jgi:uncharacterized protein YjbJ (UPF0337 family)
VRILSPLELQAMNTNEIEGNRNVEKSKLKQKFALLTNDDQLLDESKKEERLGRQQVNLGHTKKDVDKGLSDL